MQGILNEQKLKVLFVAANPMTGTRLSIDEEIREITQKISLSAHRELIDMHCVLAARPDDILQAFNQYRPHIVHFRGHSSPGMLLLHSKQGGSTSIGSEALRAVFTTLKDDIGVVVLDGCYTRLMAETLVEVIDCAIGMNDAFSDQAAITFSAAFYRALGFGRSLQEAFEQGKTALLLDNSAEHTTPVLLVRRGVNAAQVHMLPALISTQKRVAPIQRVEEMLLRGDYDAAYREIDTFLRANSGEIPADVQAKLKYVEALVHLEGKRPYIHALSVMQVVGRLLSAAVTLHDLYSYRMILAVCTYDFARNGFPGYQADADMLMRSARNLMVQEIDRANISLLSRVQGALFREYERYFSA